MYLSPVCSQCYPCSPSSHPMYVHHSYSYPKLTHTPYDPQKSIDAIFTDPYGPFDSLYRMAAPHIRQLYLKELGAPLRDGRTYEYTIADYIKEHGQPEVWNRSLNLSKKGLTSLEGIELIDNPETITVIDLSGNLLSNYVDPPHFEFINPNENIPRQPFQRFKNLRELNLNNNKLISLPKEIFQHLTRLTSLRLYENHLNILPEGIFQPLTNLQNLYLGDNQLNILPEGIFQPLTRLKVLRLENNQLNILPERIFQGLTSLHILYLSKNQLNTLPEMVFQELGRLKNLYLNENQLNTLPEGIFQPLTGLRVLYLDNNQLILLPEGIFQGLTRLITLSLNNNHLTALPVRIFQGLTKLGTLKLAGNYIEQTEQEFRTTHFLPDTIKEFIYNPQNTFTSQFRSHPYIRGGYPHCYRR